VQAYFYDLFERLQRRLRGDEILLCGFEGEDSDFVRLNRNRVRQAGNVSQRSLSIDLIEGRRHSEATCELSGDMNEDVALVDGILETLREQRGHLGDDPFLNYAGDITNTERLEQTTLPDSAEAVRTITSAAEGMDLVGLWAAGTLHHGFANSLGQRNWHSSGSFNFDWSCYLQGDQATKHDYAGRVWEPRLLEERLELCRHELELLSRPVRQLKPGAYRVYLAPAALRDIIDMMSWGGFGLKAHRTAQTPLIKMVREGRRLHPGVTLREDNERGIAPNFDESGFVSARPVTLIDAGEYRDCLVSARSGREYDTPVNSSGEVPVALDMPGGGLAKDEILSALGTGLYVNNLWYCNFSDRNNCQITGMTRFACFWVQDGEIRAPINVMRFDESVYNVLGDKLVDLSSERELILDSDTYESRSSSSYLLPGALVSDFRLTL
jgi:predicted Zn-dependent protease